MKTLKHLFEKNQAWAAEMQKNNPGFFESISKQQAPDYLWIGCADSRVPANQLLDLPPGEVFVHRNIANVVVKSDLNYLSVLQYAVEVLEVEHIIVCGHYGCGGVRAAIESESHGLIDNWLGHIRDVHRFHHCELDELEHDAKVDRLCELNVVEQVKNVCSSTIVQQAWKDGRHLSVHGWIYNIGNGILKDMDTCLTSNEAFREKFPDL